MSRKYAKSLIAGIGAIFFVSAMPVFAGQKGDDRLEEQLAISDGVAFPVPSVAIEGSQGPKGPTGPEGPALGEWQGTAYEYDTYLERQLRITDGTVE